MKERNELKFQLPELEFAESELASHRASYVHLRSSCSSCRAFVVADLHHCYSMALASDVMEMRTCDCGQWLLVTKRCHCKIFLIDDLVENRVSTST